MNIYTCPRITIEHEKISILGGCRITIGRESKNALNNALVVGKVKTFQMEDV
jgi:hypothetical protein